MIKKMKKIANLFFALFTLSTLLHSTFAIGKGTEAVSHAMLVDRGILLFLASFSYVLIKAWSSKNKVLSLLLPYCVYMGLGIAYTYVSGNLLPGGESNYLGLFLQGTIVYIVVYGLMNLPKYLKELTLPTFKSSGNS